MIGSRVPFLSALWRALLCTALALAWSCGDGAPGAGSHAAHTYAASGLYTAVVTATNTTNVLTATTPVQVLHALFLPLALRP